MEDELLVMWQGEDGVLLGLFLDLVTGEYYVCQQVVDEWAQLSYYESTYELVRVAFEVGALDVDSEDEDPPNKDYLIASLCKYVGDTRTRNGKPIVF